MTSRIRLFESVLADVTYVFGGPIPFPKRGDKETKDQFRQRLDALGAARERAVQRAAERDEARRNPAAGTQEQAA